MCARSVHRGLSDRLPRRLLTYNRRRVAMQVRWPLQERADACSGELWPFKII